jgi:uncharacterized protein YutE (UPF0331/DUF86 family)
VREVNLDRVRELAGHVRDALRQLHDLGDMPRETFLADVRTINASKYLLIVGTEAALDICNHLAARRGGRSPEDYADCFAVLGEMGAIDEDLRQRLTRMARFRNRLVHLYWKVDDAEVHRIVRDELRDLEEYLVSVGRYLKSDLG